jgi:hypothetical protein
VGSARHGRKQVKKGSSFCEQKEAKKLHLFAPGIASAQTNESFLVLFFKKERACLPRSAPTA